MLPCTWEGRSFWGLIFFSFGYKPRSFARFIIMVSSIVTLSIVLYTQIYSLNCIQNDHSKSQLPWVTFFFLNSFFMTFRLEFKLLNIFQSIHYLVLPASLFLYFPSLLFGVSNPDLLYDLNFYMIELCCLLHPELLSSLPLLLLKTFMFLLWLRPVPLYCTTYHTISQLGFVNSSTYKLR